MRDEDTTPETGNKKFGPWTLSKVRDEFADGSCSRQVELKHEDSFAATLSVGGGSVKHPPLLELRSSEMHSAVVLSISMPELIFLMREAGYQVKIPCSPQRGRVLMEVQEQRSLPRWMLDELQAVKWPKNDGARAYCHECGRLTALRRDGAITRHYRCGQKLQGVCPGTKRLPRDE